MAAIPLTSTGTGNPLCNLPAVLAIRDLQRRVARVLQDMPLGTQELVALLQLDPLAVVRGLRAANAPIFRPAVELPTIRGLVQKLGAAQARRLIDVQPIDAADTAELRVLWLHAIATANAAEDLAARTGLLEPEAAYLLGLLHDLPEWLRRLVARSGPAERRQSPTELLMRWQLPAPLTSLILAIEFGDRSAATTALTDPAALIRAAKLLAELAGFRHPGADDQAGAEVARQEFEKLELLTAHRLRRKVEAALRSFGLDPAIPEHEISASPAITPDAARTRGGLDEVVTRVLGCSRSESYRGIVTVLVAAAVRYGDYDRALYGKWLDRAGIVVIRAKADSSSRPLYLRRLVASAPEAEALRAALRDDRPTHLRRGPGLPEGLLGALSTDELLAVPVNRGFDVRGLLLLDRSLTLAPIDGERDTTLPAVLGMAGSLLIENLLRRRRQQRAQRFALTDPLTHLFNRRMGLLALEQAIASAQRSGRPLTVLMCDLDHFKRLNDTLGHLKGDAALQATATVLQQMVRRADTVCRYGGEEFLVVLPETTPDEATVLATRLFTSVHARGEELGLPLTISIGLTSLRAGDGLESLLHRADRALYASKGHGRNRFSVDVEAADELRPRL